MKSIGRMMLFEGGEFGREDRSSTEKLRLLFMIFPHLHFGLQHWILTLVKEHD